MCRRCGEPDRRGNNRDRARRKRWMLTQFGDGVTVSCTWCQVVLTVFTVTADRLVPGGSYRRDNVVPSCQPCQWARTRSPIPEGCAYG